MDRVIDAYTTALQNFITEELNRFQEYLSKAIAASSSGLLPNSYRDAVITASILAERYLTNLLGDTYTATLPDILSQLTAGNFETIIDNSSIWNTTNSISELAALNIIATLYEGIVLNTSSGLQNLSLQQLIPYPECGILSYNILPDNATGSLRVVYDFKYNKTCIKNSFIAAISGFEAADREALKNILDLVTRSLSDKALHEMQLGYAPSPDWLEDWLDRLPAGGDAQQMRDIPYAIAAAALAMSRSSPPPVSRLAVQFAMSLLNESGSLNAQSFPDTKAMVALGIIALQARLGIVGLEDRALWEALRSGNIASYYGRLIQLEKLLEATSTINLSNPPAGLLHSYCTLAKPTAAGGVGCSVFELSDAPAISGSEQMYIVCRGFLHREVTVVYPGGATLFAGIGYRMVNDSKIVLYVEYDNTLDRNVTVEIAVLAVPHGGSTAGYEVHQLLQLRPGRGSLDIASFNVSQVDKIIALLAGGNKVYDAARIGSIQPLVENGEALIVNGQAYVAVKLGARPFTRPVMELYVDGKRIPLRVGLVSQSRDGRTMIVAAGGPVYTSNVMGTAELLVDDIEFYVAYTAWRIHDMSIVSRSIAVPGGTVLTRLRITYSGPGLLDISRLGDGKPFALYVNLSGALMPAVIVEREVRAVSGTPGNHTVTEELTLQWRLPRGASGASGESYAVVLTLFDRYQVASVRAQLEVAGEQEARGFALAVVVDTSGSMRDEFRGRSKLDWAKDAASQLISMISDDDYVALIQFSGAASVLVDLDRLGAVRESIYSVLQGLTAEGPTNIGEALILAAQVLSKAPEGYQRIVVLLTDGRPTRGPDPCTAVDELVKVNARVIAIGLGDDVDGELLRCIASKTGGIYLFAPTPEELAPLFRETYRVSKGLPLMAKYMSRLEPGKTVTLPLPLPAAGDFVATLDWSRGNIVLFVDVPGLGVFGENNISLLGLNVSRGYNSLSIRGNLRLGAPVEAYLVLASDTPTIVELEVTAEAAEHAIIAPESLVVQEGSPAVFEVVGPVGTLFADIYRDGVHVATVRGRLSVLEGEAASYCVTLPPLGVGNYTIVARIVGSEGVPVAAATAELTVTTAAPATKIHPVNGSRITVKPGVVGRIVVRGESGTIVEAYVDAPGARVVVAPRSTIIGDDGTAEFLVEAFTYRPANTSGVVLLRSAAGSTVIDLNIQQPRPPVRVVDARLRAVSYAGAPVNISLKLESAARTAISALVAGDLANYTSPRTLHVDMPPGTLKPLRFRVTPPAPGKYTGFIVLRVRDALTSLVYPAEVIALERLTPSRPGGCTVTYTTTRTVTKATTIVNTVTATKTVTETTFETVITSTVTYMLRGGGETTVTVTVTAPGQPEAAALAAVIIILAIASAACILATSRRGGA